MVIAIQRLAEQAKLNGVETPYGYYVKKLPSGEFAYHHRIRKPAPLEVRTEVARDLDFPPSLVAYFETCNGGSLFNSLDCVGIYLFGCIPRNQAITRAIQLDQPPIDIRTENRTVNRDEIRIGSYGLDVSDVYLRRADETVRCCVGWDASKTRREWASIDEWLNSEINRLSQCFSDEAVCLVEDEQLLPGGKIASPRPKVKLKNVPKISIPPEYARLRGERAWPKVWITIFPLSELAQEQVGYRFHPSGKSLIGGGGNWKEEWIVIGNDDLSGDPIFIDVSKSELPAFTAEHGQGEWDAYPMARSTQVFFETLDDVQAVREGKLTMERAMSNIHEKNLDFDVFADLWAVYMENDEA